MLQCTQAMFDKQGILDMSNYYGQTYKDQLKSALTCMTRVKEKALPIMTFNKSVLAGNCLRYAFHDCTTRGDTLRCGGGIRLMNLNVEPNRGLTHCQELLFGQDGQSGICNTVRKENVQCQKMPHADCISFVGYLAVTVTDGAPQGGCGWIPGRVDTVNVSYTNVPSETHNAHRIIQVFERYRINLGLFKPTFTLNEFIVLMLGSHTIGESRYHPSNKCSKGLGPMSHTPLIFDNDYYKGIVFSNNGWFCSDMHGRCNSFKSQKSSQNDSPFALLFEKYATNNQDFLKAYCQAYQIMSLIGYTVPLSYHQDSELFKRLLV